MKERIVIAGGGFAGLSAIRALKSSTDKFEVVLIDRRPNQEFLPLLPDIIGKDFAPEAMRVNLPEECQRCGAIFREEEIISIQPDKKRVLTSTTAYPYSYLIIGMGAVTNYYGNNDIAKTAFEIKSVNSAQAVRKAALTGKEDEIVVCGGGYTGIEAVTALWLALKNAGLRKKLTILNIAPKLCAALPEKFSDYIINEVAGLGINIENNNTVESFTDKCITLKNGRQISNAMLVWVAGVKTPDCVSRINTEPTAQGRLPVNEFLQFSENIYAAGDCAAFTGADGILRMSVQNALAEGTLAARNIVRQSANKKLARYKPFDPGYIVPLSSGRSCGKVMGFRFFGKIPSWLHYLVCATRSSNFTNGMGIFKEWMKK